MFFKKILGKKGRSTHITPVKEQPANRSIFRWLRKAVSPSRWFDDFMDGIEIDLKDFK